MSTSPQDAPGPGEAARPAAVADYLNELKKRTTGDVRSDAYNRVLYSTDSSIYQIMPHGVFLPQTVEDVHAAVSLAAEYGVPLLPRTGGSSLAGQAVNEAVVIDMTRHLDAILEVNEEERWVRVQPGIVLDDLNRQLQTTGLQFGPDPASSNRAAMGGIVANNATGSHSIMYGMGADHVLETRVFLGDGSAAHFGPVEEDELARRSEEQSFEADIYRGIRDLTRSPDGRRIIQAGTPKHWRRSGGYNLDRFLGGEGVSFGYPQDHRFNLSKLIAGSEGTLGVMSEIKLGLVQRPAMTALAIVHFDSLNGALSSVPALLELGPSAIELLDNYSIALCREVPSYAVLLNRFIEGMPNSVLLTEVYGDSKAELKHKLEQLKQHIKARGVPAGAVVEALDAESQACVWSVRKAGLGLLMSIRGDVKPLAFIEDAAVPVEHLAEYVTRIQEFCRSIGTKVAYYAHASAGCLHIRPLINAKDASDVDKLAEIGSFSLELLTGFGGALCSEHGAGRSRSWLNERFFGPELYGLQKQVKSIFDPQNLFNPGILVDPQDIDRNLRYGPGYPEARGRDLLDFRADGGFQRAVEMCNGAGICRKRTSGTMCPSFMVTREEEHSTRGRANALRAALSGMLPGSELTSKRMYEVMDLCIECKACKSECPSSVDMAKIKFEFLGRYHREHGVPLRTRLFADIALVSRLSCGPHAPFINRFAGSAPARLLNEKLFGISSKRTPPPFARVPFTKWFKQHQSRSEAPLGKAVLFNDTFNTYNYPETAIAAVEVLEAAGFEVVLPGIKCCGRPMISKGLVDRARAAAKDTVSRLAPYARKGSPIIGLEPSCLLSLRDEYLALLPESEDARIVAQQAVMFDELLSRLANEGKLPLSFTDKRKHVLLHGHCHQRALIGTAACRAMLELPANYSVEEVDSGCCGMAGSFGYEAEHYDISIAMAERRLLPAVREAAGDTILAAVGVSCRQQIKHGTNRTAKHAIEVLREALVREEAR